MVALYTTVVSYINIVAVASYSGALQRCSTVHGSVGLGRRSATKSEGYIKYDIPFWRRFPFLHFGMSDAVVHIHSALCNALVSVVRMFGALPSIPTHIIIHAGIAQSNSPGGSAGQV